MITLITELILMGCLTYISYRYCNLVAAYDNTALLLENYKVWLANSENARVDTETALAAAYRTIDRMQDERDGTDFASELETIIDCTDPECCGGTGDCTYEYDDNGNMVGPDGFTYNAYASDVTDVVLDRIKWTPEDLYTPDVNGSDEF